jgi:plastocyanin domain-containing protein
MENSIGIVIGIVVVGFVVYNFFLKSDSSASAPAPVKEAPAKAPVKEVKEEVVVKAPTKAQLTSKTKKEIDDLAKNEWGIKLDARETKDKMVAQFVKEAKAIAKK